LHQSSRANVKGPKPTGQSAPSDAGARCLGRQSTHRPAKTDEIAPAQGWRPECLANVAAAAVRRPLTRRSKPAPPSPASAVGRASLGLFSTTVSSPPFKHNRSAFRKTHLSVQPVSRPARGALLSALSTSFGHRECDLGLSKRKGGAHRVHRSRALPPVTPSV
jgi:hypothetical protein